MSLTPSLYYFIFSGSKYVGRHPVEEHSLDTKPIFALPDDVMPLALWQVEVTDNGLYKLRASGAPTAENQGLLWAFLVEEGKEYEWVITPSGDDFYTVEKPTQNTVWVVTGEEGPRGVQIAVERSATGGSEQLFKFVRVNGDKDSV